MGSEAMADGGASGVAMAGGSEVMFVFVFVFVFVKCWRFVELEMLFYGGMHDRRGVG